MKKQKNIMVTGGLPEGTVKFTEATEFEISLAYEMGIQAFESGKKAVAAWDKNLMSLIEFKACTQIGASIPILDAWSKGWHTANAKAKI